MGDKLSVIIVNWRSKDFVRKCLTSLKNDTVRVDTQIIVVDGGSFDGCGEMLRNEFPEVQFIQSPDNIGFGRCNNLGFELATGNLLLLLNPDTEVRPGAIEQLISCLEGRRDIGIAGARLLNSDATLQRGCVRALPTPLNRALDSDFLRELIPRSSLWGFSDAFSSKNDPVEVQAVTGAVMLMRSEVFRSMNGFRSEYFMYGEDMDLCFRVRRAGLKIVHVPTAIIVHHGGGSSQKQVSQFSTIMMRKSASTYMRLNHGIATELSYRLLQAVSAAIRITCAIPGMIFTNAASRQSFRATVKRWWYVLKWSIGFESRLAG